MEANTSKGADHTNIRRLVQSVVRDHAILQEDTDISALDALIASLTTSEDWKASDALYAFLDNCILRLARRTMKYYGDVVDLVNKILPNSTPAQRKPISLLLIVVLEQWPYFIESAQASDLRNATSWMTRYLEILQYIGEEGTVLLHVRDKLRDQISEESCRFTLQVALENLPKVEVLESLKQRSHTKENTLNEIDLQRSREVANKTPNLMDLPFEPPREAQDHPGLTRWLKKDMSDAIEDGAVSELLICLCSKYEEIRRQAILGVESLMGKLEVCTLEIKWFYHNSRLYFIDFGI